MAYFLICKVLCMCMCMGRYFANYEWIVCLIKLKFGTEMVFDLGKAFVNFEEGAPIPWGWGAQRVGQKAHC